MALGLNLLFRLGRQTLVAPLEDTGWLPDSYYSSQALQALEENDFCACLRYVKLTGAPATEAARLVSQLLILRCRLLQEQHRRRCQAVAALAAAEPDPERAGRYDAVLAEENRALGMLRRYEEDTRAWLQVA